MTCDSLSPDSNYLLKLDDSDDISQQHFRWLDDLPEELWADIFRYVTTTTTYSEIWCLGQICHHWRQIALSNPLLWNELPCLYIEPRVIGQEERMKESLTELLSRSTDSPLFLHITMECQVEETPNEIIALLLRHSKRWRRAILRELTAEHIQAQSVTTDVQFHRLLSIDFRAGTPITFLRHASELRHIRISYSDQVSAIQDTPWSHLESYEQLGGLRRSVEHILQASPHLLNLTFKERISRHHPSEVPQTFTHSTLRQLTLLCAYGCQTLTSFLQTLTLPALEELTLSGSLTSSVQFFQTLALFMHRSKCSLVKLELLLSYLPVDQAVQLLRKTPHLRELSIRAYDAKDSNDLCYELIHGSGKAPLVPYLSSITLDLDYAVDEKMFDITGMAQIVSSRSTITTIGASSVLVQPLTSVHISGFHWPKALQYRCELEGVKLMDLNLVLGEQFQHYFRVFSVTELVGKLVNSEEMRMQCNFQHICYILDVIHLTAQRRKMDKIHLLKQLEEHKLISMLDDKLHLRQWMLVGSELMYIPPNHRIRNTLHRWLLVMGTGHSMDIPYLMGRELYPTQTPEYLQVVNY